MRGCGRAIPDLVAEPHLDGLARAGVGRPARGLVV
jgi:hypothetical protein